MKRIFCVVTPHEEFYFRDGDKAHRAVVYLTSLYGGYRVGEVNIKIAPDSGQQENDVGDVY